MTVPLPPGAQVINGRYLVQRSLGRGAQGEVYEVLDHHQDEVVALKLIAGVNVGPWHEAQVLTRLRDDHILPIRNAELASGQPFIVTELARSGTVDDRLQANGHVGVSPDQAVRWVRQVCQAVTRTHDAELLHTDVKPANLFLNDRGDVLLGDFGLASLIDANGLGHLSGSPQTLAPEVAAAIVAGDTRGTTVLSDVYSIGASLYWMLSGTPPFDPPAGLGLVACAPLICGHSPKDLHVVAPHLPQALVQRVRRAMDPTPSNRYRSPGELAAAIGEISWGTRVWARTDEHTAHVGCWRGTPVSSNVGRTTIRICCEPRGSRVEVSAMRLPSGRAISQARTICPPSQLPAAVRKAIRAVN